MCPNAVKGEFVNFGIILFERAANDAGFADVRFTNDWKRVRCLDPQADITFLAELETDIRTHLIKTGGREDLIRRIEDSFSNAIQLSGVKGCLSEDPTQELQLLTRLYLKPRVVRPAEKPVSTPEPEPEYPHGAGRHYVLGVMENASGKREFGSC